MMKVSGLTVEDLLRLCRQQCANGNGKKTVLISTDDEGNGFHTLYYGFADTSNNALYAQYGMFADNNNPDDVVLLG